MTRLSEKEKKSGLGGVSSRGKGASRASSYKKLHNCNARLNNFSLLALATIPGLISLVEELYSLISSKTKASIQRAGYGGGTFTSSRNNYLDSRRDFFAYASEAFRPSIRFSPYYYKSGITFGLPWIK